MTRNYPVLEALLIPVLSTITVPASSALFNQKIIQGFESLDIPANLKIACLSDISSMRQILPPDNLDVALAVVVEAINTTFIIGLVCSVISVVFILCIPWKPVTKGEEKNQGEKGSQLNF